MKLVFKSFLKEQTLAQTAKALNAANIRTPRLMKGGDGIRATTFRIDMVHSILKQRSYLGVRVFKSKDGTEETKAAWNAIIGETSFDRVQKILTANHSRKKPHTAIRYPYVLSGFLFCKSCGDRMGGKSAHGKNAKIAYYEHSWATKSQALLSKKVFSCEPHRILAKKIEPVVWDSVKEFLQKPSVAKVIFSEAKEKAIAAKGVNEAEKVQRKIAGVTSQIEALAERIGQLPPGIDPKVLFDQLAKLQRAKADLETELATKQNETTPDQPLALEDFTKFTLGLKALTEKEEDPVIRSHIISSLVKRIDVHKTGIEIQFHVGQSYYLREFGDFKKSSGSRPFFVPKRSLGDENSVTGRGRRPLKGTVPLEKYLKDRCSNSLQNGGGKGK